MNSIDRFRLALAHQEPDRVPFDLGGSIVTSIAAGAYEQLVPALGLPPRPVKIGNLYSQTAVIDEDVFQKLKVDTRPVRMCDPDSWKLEIMEKDGYSYYTDEWGITYSMPLGGTSGYSIYRSPLREATTVQEIERYPMPDFSDPSRYRTLVDQVQHLALEKNTGVIVETAIGGIFEWPAWLRGMDNFLADIAGNPAMTEAIIEKIFQTKLAFWETALSLAGHWIDLVRESDDLGGQNGLLISPKAYRKYVKPYHTRICETIRKYSNVPICLHSCGAVWDLIPDIIESGFTVLNPVQVSAAKMDPAALKREYGKELAFWGGSFDSQYLGKATAAEVKTTARRHLEIFAPGGGYIFAPINVISNDVPPENIIALAEVVHEFGSY